MAFGLPPLQSKGGAGSGRAKPVPRRLLGAGRWVLPRLRLHSAERHPMPGTKAPRQSEDDSRGTLLILLP